MLESKAGYEISVARLVQLGRLHKLHESHAACSGGPASVDQGGHLGCVSQDLTSCTARARALTCRTSQFHWQGVFDMNSSILYGVWRYRFSAVRIVHTVA